MDIFERQIDFIRKSAIPLAMVGLLNALPDTQLWRRLEREGRLLGNDATGNNTVCSLNFKTIMDPALLIQGYQRIMQTIYSPREYYERALVSMKRTATEFTERPHYNALNAGFLTRILSGWSSIASANVLALFHENCSKTRIGLRIDAPGSEEYHVRNATRTSKAAAKKRGLRVDQPSHSIGKQNIHFAGFDDRGYFAFAESRMHQHLSTAISARAVIGRADFVRRSTRSPAFVRNA